MRLVIVESPAKARTISGYLGEGYVVESSIGHVRDLPRRAADIPASHKKEQWARLGVDTENDFMPLYIVPKEKKQQISKLKKLLKRAALHNRAHGHSAHLSYYDSAMSVV